MMTIFLRLSLLTAFILPALSFANEEEGGHHAAATGIPTEVYLQAANFLIFVGLLVYFLRQPVKNYFASRGATFNAAVEKARAARIEAENKNKEIKDKLYQIETEQKTSLAQAQKEAELLKQQLVAEGRNLAAKLKVDAERTLAAEVEKARIALRVDLLAQSTQMAQKVLADKNKLQEQDQARLQTEFVDKIQVVSQ